ncbi:hypothetical protein [Myroides sp. WP-1]|uniref:hypothetical protein n=1 Tax=Myroides sp. WP-1 TaxID=2759944 RepID=UPI0015F84C04|nr:hypothetical protein [Myroides sp. WP-1]MBB1140663.1 hypothetical protein [Myroides sp. WP-1]
MECLYVSDNFEQIFDAQKLLKDGVVDPDKFVKEKIVKLIKDNAEEFFKDEKIRNFLIREGIDDTGNINVNSSFIKRFKAK